MNDNIATNQRWNRWHVLGAVFMVLLGILATWHAWYEIFSLAIIDEEYSHILLVPLVAFWLVWVRRMRLRHCPPAGMWVGPIVLSIGWLIASYGFYNGIQSFWHGGSVIVVIGCALSVLGKNVLFRFFPAFAVLIFLVPVPGLIRQRIALPLQTRTAEITEATLAVIGVPTDRSGNLLSINGTAVTIAEACNGLRMVFALILVSFAFSFGLPLKNWVRFTVLLASPVAAIFCNVIRMMPTVWLYGYQSKEIADMFHNYSGWLMLPIAFLILMGIIKMLQWAMVPVTRYTLAT